MTPSRFSFDEISRAQLRTSLDETLMVEASAGTGKTRELVQRIVDVIREGARVEKLAALTFTHAAAGEMKLRIRQELDRARQHAEPLQRDRLSYAVEHLEEAFIGTIHSFCAQMIRERPVEACVDPGFTEIAALESSRLFAAVFREWFRQRLDTGSPALQRALTWLGCVESRSPTGPIDQLRMAAWKLSECRQYHGGWARRPMQRRETIREITAELEELWNLRQRCPRQQDQLYSWLTPLEEALERLRKTADLNLAESIIVRLHRDRRYPPRYGPPAFAPGITRQQALAAVEQALHSLACVARTIGADFAAELRPELLDMTQAYEDAKRRAGSLDFTDLLLCARGLLRDNAEVRKYFQNRLDYVFVDEYQDTDVLQTEIVLLLAADDPNESNWQRAQPKKGKLFLVGDPKQSIYRFRSADVDLYRRVRRQLAEQGAQHVALSKSHRSVENLQHFVNAAFEGLGGPLEGGRCDPEMQPSLIVLPAPAPYENGRKPKKNAIDACLPGTVAGYIQWVLEESSWKVTDPAAPDRYVPLQPGHICVLFRRFVNNGNDVTREYVRALDSRAIPHVLIGSRFFHKREEIGVLRTALNAIEWPEDELSVYAFLRGPLFGVTDETLFLWRSEFGRLSPWSEAPARIEDRFRPVVAGLRLVFELHRDRNSRPVADTLSALLEAARAHAGFAFRRGGDQVLANVYRLCDLARRFESTTGSTFRSFVEFLNDEAEGSETSDAPVLEDNGEGVRLMTVHNAKGLEFPVVILADMTAQLSSHEPDRYTNPEESLCATRLLRCAPWELLDHEQEEKEKDEEEGVRVCYVAATRARDLLVVTACGDEPWQQSWLSPLHEAVYPHKSKWRVSREAAGCPRFGRRTTLSRPLQVSAEEISVRPGLHSPAVGAHKVVWWDPELLNWERKQEHGLPHQDLLVGSPEQFQTQMADYDAWRALRGEALATGAAPRTVLVQAAESAIAAGRDADVEFRSIARPGRNVGGRRFGTLVHSVLQDADWGGDPASIELLTAMHARLIGATDQERAAAVDVVITTLRNELVLETLSAEYMHREWPIVVNTGDGHTIEGAVDLAYYREGRWTLVDFKTDGDLQARRARYAHQMRQYVAAIQRVTGADARGIVLGI